jgi:hypothetical protein
MLRITVPYTGTVFTGMGKGMAKNTQGLPMSFPKDQAAPVRNSVGNNNKDKRQFTCIFHALSPDSHSVYVLISFVADS